MILKTDIYELELRKVRLNDKENIQKYANNYNIWKSMRDEFPRPFTEINAEEYIYNSMQANNKYSFVISFKDNLIGDIHINIQNDILRYSGFLGYWISEIFWGQGYATECVKTLLNFTITQNDMNRIFSRVFANNLGSIKVLEKTGFKREGYFEKAVFKEGTFIDQIQYGFYNDKFTI